MSKDLSPVERLARLCGVETSYWDIIANERRYATPEALLAVFRALGVGIERIEDAEAVLAEERHRRWPEKSGCPPVIIAWDGGPATVALRLGSAQTEAIVQLGLHLETGESRRWTVDLGTLHVSHAAEWQDLRAVVKHVTVEGPLPLGYHRLSIEILRERHEALLISAPTLAYRPDEKSELNGRDRLWGVFAPLFSLHSATSWGCGDFSDLERMANWVAGLGGGVVGTLPLLASFLDEPFDPSPYSPVSRRFWNELYLDVARIPELERFPGAAKTLLESGAFREELNALRGSEFVEYPRAMALKRRVLEELCRCFFSAHSVRQEEFHRYADARPVLQDYSRFRAACEHQRTVWHVWPERMRGGDLREGDYDEAAQRYHLYVQWLAHEQLEEFSRRGKARGVGLYLDLPLGVHPDGYDTWRERNVFAWGLAGGAPPDGFFTRGQDWGFPPLHPERIREQGYGYFIACLRHHLQFASVLRLDHVMSLHRLFCVPNGMEAARGVYIHYHSEELYAILALESWRHRALIVGEDLGTVPPYVRPAMTRHGIQRMYVAQFEIDPNPDVGLRPVFPEALAGVNTHDTATFAGFWKGLDIDLRVEMGLLNEDGARRERDHRRWLCHVLTESLRRGGFVGESSEPQDDLRGALACMGAGAARVVIANLEDLWGEEQPQNVPGTRFERPNWRRKFRYPVEVLREKPEVVEPLRVLNEKRKQKEGQ